MRKARERTPNGTRIAPGPRASAIGRPSRPHGRSTSTPAITTNSTASVSLEKPRAKQDALIIPMSRAAGHRPGNRPDPAHPHDDEGVGDHAEVDFQARRLARDRERAAQAGERRAE